MLARGTKGSVLVDRCQICGSPDLMEIISLGHIPQVNVMQPIGSRLQEETIFPAELLKCNQCSLVQIGHIVDPELVFPPTYSYVSRTTKILRENFAELADEVIPMLNLTSNDLVADIGSNDGTLLSNFKNKCQVLGVEPTNAAKYANENGIPTIQQFFNVNTVKEYILPRKASVITAANVFAHIEDVHSIVDAIKLALDTNGVFISENHYLVGLLKTVQYDTIYHEHLRYLSLTSLKYLFDMHDMEIFHAKYIPTHGGSIRVYAALKGTREIMPSVAAILEEEKAALTNEAFAKFKAHVVASKTALYHNGQEWGWRSGAHKIGAIGAPSRAATLVSYIGLNEDLLEFVLEAPGSQKIGHYMPGTKIPILEETPELLSSMDVLLLLSWHIADELMPKIRAKGFKGKFITPLPYPRKLDG
jgi:C-methyltransferase C-terminal domain/Putative zinc binding domain/Methyltransferase domain